MSGAQGFREVDGPGGSATICGDEKSWASTETLSPPKPGWQTHSPQAWGLCPPVPTLGAARPAGLKQRVVGLVEQVPWVGVLGRALGPLP